MEQFKYRVLIARITWCIGNKICHTMMKQCFAVIIFNKLALLLGEISSFCPFLLRFPAFLADDSVAFGFIPVRDDMKKCTPLILASSSSSLRRFASISFIEVEIIIFHSHYACCSFFCNLEIERQTRRHSV